MSPTRQDVMFYSALVAAVSAIFAGLLFDWNKNGTAWAFVAISIFSVLSLATAYMHTPEKD